MNILIDIGHPAHVHLFRNLASRLIQNGHKVHFTLREKEHEMDLLQAHGFTYESFGKKYNSVPGKLWGLLKFGYLETKAARRFKADLFLSHGSMYAAHAAAILGKPHIALEDVGNREQVFLYKPFTKAIFSPDVLGRNFGKKHYFYPGYHELAYLHPNSFTPNPDVYEFLGLPSGAPYAILRFIGWNATHDIGKSGLSLNLKRELVRRLSKRMRVFVSAEIKANDEFAPYQIKIPPHRMHDALAFATLYIGEGTTMAAEAGLLGTPSFYVSNVKGQNCEDLEKYGLVYVFEEPAGLSEKLDEVLSIPDVKEEWARRRNLMLADKIDITSFLQWFIESYPESLKTAEEKISYSLKYT